MRSRILAILIALAMVSATLAGCVSPQAATTEAPAAAPAATEAPAAPAAPRRPRHPLRLKPPVPLKVNTGGQSFL